ncbi:MAG: CoA pyrophosphatase [Chloroflexi bacterium]|nr:MAG: CoA pyrophosphatase [Chloroflexota bacterium]
MTAMGGTRLRFDDVVARLAKLPDPLPAPPAVLMPVRTDGVTRFPSARLQSEATRAAAVLVLVVPGGDGEARVILTERVDRGGHHSGEVSFPGGSAEPYDADVAATALREAREEVGLDADAAGVRIVGMLEQFWIPVSDFRVTPVLAIAERRPVLAASPSEVARIVEAPLAAFLPDAEIEVVERTIRNWPLRYGAYPVDGLRVWGATARVLGQLGAILGAV